MAVQEEFSSGAARLAGSVRPGNCGLAGPTGFRLAGGSVSCAGAGW